MSDKKNSHNTELEANLAKIANTKPRKRTRNDNIYERFITRVESVESVENNAKNSSTENSVETTIDAVDDNASKENPLKPLRNANKLSSYEPLSEAELALFSNQAPADEVSSAADTINDDLNNTGIDLDFSDDDNYHNDNHNENLTTTKTSIAKSDESLISASDATSNYHADSADTEDLAHPDITQTAVKDENSDVMAPELANKDIDNEQPLKPKNKQFNSKKPLVIGMIFGSLLIVAVVMTLLFTGVLSTSTPTNVSNSTEIPVADSKPVVSTEPIDAGTPKEIQAVDARIVETPTAASDNQTDVDSPESVEGQQGEATSTDSGAEAAITYEDFREESQSTLYREVND